MSPRSLLKEFPYMSVSACHTDRKIFLELKENSTICEQDVDEFMRSFETLTKAGYHKVITVATVRQINISTETLTLLAQHPLWVRYSIKHAIITNHSNLRILTGIYLRFCQPQAPTKCFNHISEAEKWLDKISKK